MLEDMVAMAAVPAPVPPLSTNEVFTSDQWRTLLSICEVFLPSISSSIIEEKKYAEARSKVVGILPDTADDNLADRYLAENVVMSKDFKEALNQRFARYVPQAQVQGLASLLSALNSKIGCLVMTGSMVSLHDQDLLSRTKIVMKWAHSYLDPCRALYQAAEFLTKATWLAQSSVLHQILDYPKVPRNIERHPGYDFKFLDFSNEPANAPVQIDADVIIIGSGCGAGVVAEHLSSSLSRLNPKPRILLLEKGYHFSNSHFPMDQSAAGVNLQEGGGGVLSDDGSIAVLAGSTWGGGGTVNWSASLQPQHFVREEWAAKNRLPFMLSQEFQECLDEVCDKMGVCKPNDLNGLAQIEHNFGNSTLLEGARRLGLTAKVVPQNSAGKHHYCGRCSFGCASSTKQGPATFWLPAAAEQGTEFVEGCFVEKIIWDESRGPKRNATGVKATWVSRARDVTRQLNISAKHIIVSSGTLHSPLLLHRSGLTPAVNGHIGSNLHLHPAIGVHGTYPQRANPWDGAILTTVMTGCENLDGNGHGAKVEVNLGTPDITGTIMPSRPQLSLSNIESTMESALDYRVRIARHGHAFAFIVIARDHAEAGNSKKSYVYCDPNDMQKVRVNYTPSPTDRKHLLEAAIAAARMHFVMGAKTIDIFNPNISMFERPTARTTKLNASQSRTLSDEDAFENWLSDIRASGISLFDPRTSRVGSAHQMGTCRMSASPTDGVVDPRGKVWDTENVYIADASILPSASGVNPMISNMGLSLHVARGIAKTIEQSWEC
ncbi:hypothetical protein OHC33_010395 [Knufia fluminis]|uniref:Long-chain-alcohol oxidase n=1 Tax=Knufia fluminis TaxID=191047 RepID=A0AAN8I3Q7_9EURO|nr:hypothetical protein OHC33_010395 [Knufia fluminis]